MGLLDAIYIIDDKDIQIFEHILNTSTPTFNYIYSKLEAKRRQYALSNSVDVSGLASVFDESTAATLDPIVQLDANWQVAWMKVESLVYLILSPVSPEYLEVYSEDEGEDDEEEKEEEEEEEGDREIVKKEKNRVQISHHVNPLQYFQFINQFIEICKVFIGIDKLTPGRVKSNGHKLMLILQEMVDGSVPLITDSNQLQELLPNDSIIKKLLSTTKQLQHTAQSSINTIAQSSSIMPQSQRSSISSVPVGGGGAGRGSGSSASTGPSTGSNSSTLTTSILEKSGNQTPWRRINAKHTQNEMFIDITETINLIIPSSKPIGGFSSFNKTSSYYNTDYTTKSFHKRSQPLLATINGAIDFKSSLSGHPTVELLLSYGGNLGIPSFHRCVDLNKWSKTPGTLVYVPPEDKFRLMDYQINLLENAQYGNNIWNNIGLVDVDLISGLGTFKDEFEIRVNIKLVSTVKTIEDLKIEIYPPQVVNPNSNFDDRDPELYIVKINRLTHGDLQFRNGKYDWEFDKQQVTGVSCILKGQLLREDQQYDHDYDKDNDDSINVYNGPSSITTTKTPTPTPTPTPAPAPNPTVIIKPRFIKVSYTSKGYVPSNLKVKSLRVLSGLKSNVKPFKGVKYISNTGDVTLR